MDGNRDPGGAAQADRYDEGLDSISDIDDLEEASYRTDTRGTGVGLNSQAGDTPVTRGGLLANRPVPSGGMGWIVAGALAVAGVLFLCLAAAALAGDSTPAGATNRGPRRPCRPTRSFSPRPTALSSGACATCGRATGGLAIFGLPISTRAP